MAKIRVEFNYTTTIGFEVEADNIKEARAKANEEYNEMNEVDRARQFYDNLVYDTTRFFNNAGEEIGY